MNLIHEKGELARLRGELHSYMQGLPTKQMPDGSNAFNIGNDELTEVNKRSSEIEALAAKIDGLEKAAKAAAPVNGTISAGGDAGAQTKDGFAALAEKASGLRLGGDPIRAKFTGDEFRRTKATVTMSSGYAAESVRTGEIIESVYPRPQILDFMQMIPWDQAAYVFMAETTRTNATVPKTEVAAGDESTLIWAEQSVNLETIPAYLPVSEKSMRYSAELRRLIEDRLPKLAREVLGSQVLTGDGTAPNLRGLNNVTGVQTQAKGSDPTPTAILNAMVAVMNDSSASTGGASPNLLVLHPLDWAAIMDTRTADGIYIIGDPANRSPFGQPLWGLNVVVTSQQTQNTGLVLDSNYFAIAFNETAGLEFTNSHGEQFANRVTMFRFVMDAALVPFRGTAACKVTGI